MSDGSLAPLASARLLVFRVGTLVCAAEVDQVREILPRLPTTRIPGAPPVVEGLANVRGTLVTVVDGWRALGQERPQPPPPPASDSPTSSTLILEVPSGEGQKLVGFTVDEVIDMLGTSGGETALEDRAALPGVDPTLVRAVGRRNGQIFIVLDVAALLGPIVTT